MTAAILGQLRANNRGSVYPTHAGRSFVQGDHAALEGKLGEGDSRSAYVARRGPDGTWRAVGSFWFYSDAAAYVREHGAS